MKLGRPLAKSLVLIVCLALMPGCVEDLIKAFYPVSPTDGEVPYPDGAIGFDGKIPHKLTLKLIKPAHGPFAGGTEVVLSGSGFTKKAKIRIGGTTLATTAIKLQSPVSIKVTTPPGKLGPADVEVIQGAENASLEGGFNYDPVYFDPDSGPAAGGTLVTLHGKDTAFKEGIKLMLGGKALSDVEVVSSSVLRARTPSGSAGPVELTMGSAGGDKTIQAAYTYYQSANQKTGGMGGGKLAGTLTVDVLDWLYRSPVSGARVVVQKGRSFTLSGTTGATGNKVFSSSQLTGPISVSVGKKGYESTSLISFDARDVTVFLLPIPNPQPGPLPPGQSAGLIRGHLLFGGVTGVGSPKWKLVPEPKGANQVKRAYVFTSVPRIAWGPPSYGSGAMVDYDKKESSTAWPFSMYARTGGMAIWAVAGIYDKATAKFEPYAMGVTRGLVVGPGDTVKADIWITIPLTEKVTVKLQDVPSEVTRYQIRHAIDLGADGLLMRMDQEAKGDGVPASWTFGRLPTFVHQGLLDATHTVDVMLDTGNASQLPMTRATERLVQPKAGQILVDKFLGVPRQLVPVKGQALQGNTIQWTSSGAAPTLAVTIIRKTDETPVWRIISAGTVSAVKLPDPKLFGLPPWPSAPVVWLQYLAYLPGVSFDNYTYYHLSSNYWKRWSYDEFSFKGP